MKNWLFPLWIIVDLLVFLCSFSLWIVAPEYTTLNLSLSVFGITLGIVLLIVKKDEVRAFMKSQFFKKIVLHGINVFLVFSIVGLVNFLGNKNYKEWDFSQNKINSLTDQTLKIIDLVDEKLELKVFAKREEWKSILDVLKLYQAQNKNIKVEAIDLDVRPDLVAANGISTNRTVLIDYKNKKSRFVITDELSITNALLKVVKDKELIIYFTSGHQELSCSETNEEGISILCEQLKNSHYVVKEIDLSQTKKIPADASALIVAGPVDEFFESEVKQIKEFTKTGGALLLALAPSFKTKSFKNLKAITHNYGLEMGYDLVIDRLSTIQGSEATIPVISQYSQHLITQNFKARTVFPLSSSVASTGGNDTAHILAQTSSFPGSWAETNLAAAMKGNAEYKDKEDLPGPIGLMGVGELVQGEGAGARLVALGSSSFMINAYQNQSGNLNLFLNATSWLLNDEGIIALNRPGIENHPVLLSEQHIQMIFVIAILIVPLVFFSCAVFVYRRRRLQ